MEWPGIPPLGKVFRWLGGFKNPSNGQSIDEGEDDDPIRDCSFLRPHFRARRSAHVVKKLAHALLLTSPIVTPNRSQRPVNSACNSLGVTSM